ncbi:unnamed protein product [Calicophoron daubneyi]|uniref:acetyl-CoA C-acyltransferase n=1 Tax=Calicophoron daubneyi TaxID=300641 RepID=A0AAV2TN00_CALDB
MFSVVRVSPVARAGCSRTLATVASSSSAVRDKKNLRKPGGKDIVLIDGVRTPFLVSGTKYKDVMLHDLAKDAFRGVVRRTGIDKNQVEYIAFGSVVQDVQTANVAREAALAAGFPENIPAHTCTMACISSNQAVTTCIGGLLTGTFNVAIAGGGDFLSDIPIRLSKTMRQTLFSLKKTKNRLEQLSIVSKLLWPSAWKPDLPSLSEFSSGETMGHYGDRLASAFRVTRAEQDEYGMRSHKLARKASDEGLLSDIIAVKVPGYSDYIERDNGIRPATPEVMAKLKPAFIRPHGTVTAGTSSFLTDGASACLLTTSEHAKKIGLSAKAYLRDFVYVSQDPVDQLLLGPSYAIPRLLQRNGLTLADIDVFEIHEAFAGQVLANLKALDCDFFCKEYLGLSKPLGAIPIEKLNTWGGSVSLGHPFGATGVRLIVTAANRMRAEGGRLALVSACAAGGLGHAMLIETC